MAHFAQPYPQDDRSLEEILGFAGMDLGSGPANAQPGSKKPKAGKTTTAKAKNKDKVAFVDDGPVEERHEGYYLTQLPTERGQQKAPSWTRVGKRPMPVDDRKIAEIAQEHRRRTNRGPIQAFQSLTGNQQGIVERLRAEKMQSEMHPDAIWVLHDLEKIEKNVQVSWMRMERKVHQLRVILKRLDKRSVNPRDNITSTNAPVAYDFGEIIDLAEPLLVQQPRATNAAQAFAQEEAFKPVKVTTKKPKQKSKDDIVVMPEDDPYMEDLMRQIEEQDRQQQHQRQPQPQHPPDPFAYGDPFANLQQGPGPMPVPPQHMHPQQQQQPQQQQPQHQQTQHQQPQHQQPQHQQPQHQQPVPPHAPRAQHANPFLPEFGHPAQWDFPESLVEQPGFAGPRVRARSPARSQSRSRSRERELERERERERARERSRAREIERERERSERRASEERRHRLRLEEKVEELVLNTRVGAWNNNISSRSSQGSAGMRDGVWSPPLSAGSFTPPSTPDLEPRGSLHRRPSTNEPRREKYYQDRRGRYREEQIEFQPAYTYQSQRELERERSRRAANMLPRPRSRLRLTQAPAYQDDYPLQAHGRREVPLQRRVTDYPEAYVEAADFNRRPKDRNVFVTERVEVRREVPRSNRYDGQQQFDRRDNRDRDGRRYSMAEAPAYYD